jgi:Pectinacetylesterase
MRHLAILLIAVSFPAVADELRPGWNRIPGAAGTGCSDGSPFAFYVRRADSNRLLIHLMGGGACWSAETCDPERGPYQRSLAEVPDPAQWRGVFDLDNPENPFAGWSMVFVPYCTADVHLGDRSAEYELPARDGKPASRFTIRHNGWRNMTTSLEWAFAHLPKPRRIFVVGTSAGALGSPIAAALVADRNRGAAIVQLGDGASGYRVVEAAASAAPTAWNLTATLPQWDGLRGQSAETITFEALYLAASRRHPEITFATCDSAEDEVQLSFLKLGGAAEGPLLPRMLRFTGTVAAGVPHFSSYIAGGASHALLPFAPFYTYLSKGVRLRDWVAALADGKPAASVRCADCARPELRFSAQDVALLQRADQLLAAPDRWDPKGSRPCPREPAARLSLDCALERAARDTRAPAAPEDLSYEVGAAADRVRQRLQAWNNAPGRTFAEVKALLAREQARAKASAVP